MTDSERLDFIEQMMSKPNSVFKVSNERGDLSSFSIVGQHQKVTSVRQAVDICHDFYTKERDWYKENRPSDEFTEKRNRSFAKVMNEKFCKAIEDCFGGQ